MQETNVLTIDGEWKNFLTLPQEKILIIKRKHPFLVIVPIFFTLILASILAVISFYLFAIFLSFPFLFVSNVMVLIILSICLIVKIFIDWYFHLYIVTTHKVLEVRYAPLTKHQINEVLLDQVTCTEVDTQLNGIVSELLDIGNVIMTFDRSAYQEAFVFSDIYDPRKIRAFLLTNLNFKNRNESQSAWYPSDEEERKVKLMGQIFPRPQLEI